MEKLIWVRQKKGMQQTKPEQKGTLRALGLHGIGTENYIKDSRAVRGMVTKIQHLLEADLVDAKKASEKKAQKKADRKGYKLG